MKRQEEFVWGESERGAGWVLASMPHFDPVHGMALAHDLLEHTDTYPGMEGEAMAFGGICYIRVDGGYMDQAVSSRGGQPDRVEYARTLGDELAGFFRWDDKDNWKLEHITEPALDDDEMEALIFNIARACCRIALAEFVDTDGEWERRALIRKASVSLIPWIRRGFRKCEAFWGAGNPQQMSDLFSDIESTIDLDIQYADHQPGDRIEVTINDDLTWGLRTLEGNDVNGDYYENGELYNPEEEFS